MRKQPGSSLNQASEGKKGDRNGLNLDCVNIKIMSGLYLKIEPTLEINVEVTCS